MNRPRLMPLCLLLGALLPFSAAAGTHASGRGISEEISADLAEARREVREELAAARAELERENLSLGEGLHIGKSGRNGRGDDRPKAEITPAGDFLIDGKAVAIEAGQRRELLAYRGQVIAIAHAGIEIGERSAEAALRAVDRGLFGLLFSAMTGSLERRIEKEVYASLEPGLRQICGALPDLLESQQRLAASLPEFRPYATLEADDVDDCMDEIRREFAHR
jgi:hypothetical protein